MALKNTKEVIEFIETGFNDRHKPKKIRELYNLFITETKLDVAENQFRYILKKYETGELSNVLSTKTNSEKPKKETQVSGLELPKDFDISPIKMREIHSVETFVPLRTNTLVDKFFSDHTKEGGIVTGIYIVVGDPGVGKTTLLAKICLDIEKNENIEPLFMNGEMTRTDFRYEALKAPTLLDLNMMFFTDYEEYNPMLIVEKFFSKGYKLIVLDSFKVILDRIRHFSNKIGHKMTESAAESWLINLMKKYNEENGTTFLVIQQINKGGDFVGSKALEHDTTGMLEMRHSKGGKRYLMFSKNRRNGNMIKTPLYYFKNDNNEIEFDVNDYELRMSSREVQKQNEQSLKEMEKSFDELLDTTSGVKVDLKKLGKIYDNDLEDIES